MPDVRSTYQANSENVLRRDVGDKIALLYPNETAILVMSIKAQRKQATKTPKVEVIEDAMRPLWGQADGAGYDNAVTTVNVVDGSIFSIGDLVAVLKPVASTAAEEVMRVTNVVVNALTVVRGVGGGADVIAADNPLAVIGSAYEEGSDLGAARSTAKGIATSYTQIFKTPVKFTGTMMSTEVYGDPDYDYQTKKAMREHKREIERAALWSRPSETLASPNTIRTTMGIKSRIATNVFNANGNITLTLFNDFSEMIFEFGAKTKVLIASPRILSAINFFSQQRLLTAIKQTVFGVDIQEFNLPHGTLLLARDWFLEAGVAGQPGFEDEAYAVDIENVQLRPLAGYGKSRDTHVIRDVIKAGQDSQTDEVISELAWLYTLEQTHGRIFGVTGYQ